jgi:hypothetical protein
MQPKTKDSLLRRARHTAGKLGNQKRLHRSAGRIPQSAEAIADRAKSLSALEEKADWLIWRGREANTECGRTFLEIKNVVGHSNWIAYFKKRFLPKGVALRTAQEWMALAKREMSRKADSDKYADSAYLESELFRPATDEEAVERRATNARATALRHKPKRIRLEGPAIYNVPLPLTGDQRDAMDQLVGSEHWREAEKRFVDFSQQLFVEYGIINAA